MLHGCSRCRLCKEGIDCGFNWGFGFLYRLLDRFMCDCYRTAQQTVELEVGCVYCDICFECHAEIHHYNSTHPKGRKFQPTELRQHKNQGLAICRERPEIFVHSQPPPEAGSIERLLNELEFNMALANAGYRSGRLADIQFKRAIADGIFTWISEDLKNAIMAA